MGAVFSAMSNVEGNPVTVAGANGVPMTAGQAAILGQQSNQGFGDYGGAQASFTEFSGAVSTFSAAVQSFVAALKYAPGSISMGGKGKPFLSHG
jgi:hypothetical protein